jgi:hypothetical protein
MKALFGGRLESINNNKTVCDEKHIGLCAKSKNEVVKSWARAGIRG